MAGITTLLASELDAISIRFFTMTTFTSLTGVVWFNEFKAGACMLWLIRAIIRTIRFWFIGSMHRRFHLLYRGS